MGVAFLMRTSATASGRHCKARGTYSVVKLRSQQKVEGFRRPSFASIGHAPQVDECCLTCVIFNIQSPPDIRLLQAARQQIATSSVRSELGSGEDSVSGVTSARAHLA